MLTSSFSINRNSRIEYTLIMGGMPFFNRYVCYRLRNCIPQYAKAYHS